MPEYQKRHISVSPDERRRLEEDKRRYGRDMALPTGAGFSQQQWGLGLLAWVSTHLPRSYSVRPGLQK